MKKPIPKTILYVINGKSKFLETRAHEMLHEGLLADCIQYFGWQGGNFTQAVEACRKLAVERANERWMGLC